MKKITLYFIFSLFLGAAGVAQSQKQLRADDKYNNLAYYDALKLYQDVIADEAEEDNKFVMLRMANCYRMLGNPEQAVKWYEKGLTREAQPIMYLYYAQALKQLGKYEEAKTQYTAYKQWAPDDPRAEAGLASLEEAERMKNRPFIFDVVGFNAINSEYNEFAPFQYNKEILFTSDRTVRFKIDREFGWTGNPFADNFATTFAEDGSVSTPELMRNIANAQYNDGLANYNPAKNMVVFTRNQYNPGIVFSSVNRSDADDVVKLKVMLARVEDGKWQNAVEASFNNKDYSYTHPTFSEDGRYVYFVSDQPGGFGGTDLYKAKLTEDLLFTEVQNLGPDINTAGDEMFPFIDKKGVLYFASNGHPGIGGLDVFKATKDGFGNYQSVFNLGAPFNSIRDDFGVYTEQGKDFYLSSNRVGGKGGDDIYRAKLTGVVVKLEVLDATTGQPIEGAKISIAENGNMFSPVTTNRYGVVQYPLNVDKSYSVVTNKSNYDSKTATVSTMDAAAGEVLEQKILLNPDYNAYISGIVIEEASQLPVADAQVTLLNLDNGEKETVKTDFTGLYKIEWYPGFNYQITGDKEGYEPDIVNLSSTGIQPNSELKQNLELGQGAFVCNVEFDHIYFNFDKANIREDASVDLEKMYQILSNSTKVRVEIGAHTDSRGTDLYNDALSERRAQSVVDWLVDKGIDMSRLIAKGYGEQMIKNRCENGIDCSDIEHQENRRVEFKVINENNDVICESGSKQFSEL